ncbi:MAG: hypothetical protein WAK60_04610 [Sedimentisphaerales bacterium]
MDTRRKITRLDQRLHQWEHSLVLSSEKLVHKKEFWEMLITSLVLLGLMVALVLTRKPVAW